MQTKMSDFGSTFKNARLSKGLTLDQIAAETRIGTRFLEAIENEQFDRLPGGIFSRGFVRSYAECLKLDPDKAVADFDRKTSYQAPAVMETVRVNATAAEKPKAEKINKALYPVAIAALIVLVIVVYFLTNETGRSTSGDQSAVQTAPATSTSPPVTEPPAGTVTQPPIASSPAVSAAPEVRPNAADS